MLHLTTLFALRLIECERRLQISQVKNISNIFELSIVAFCPAAPYGELLVSVLVSIYIAQCNQQQLSDVAV